MDNKDIRWQQRFSNYKKVLKRLQVAIASYEDDIFEDVEKAGIIKFFEMTFELAWNIMKDYYEDQGETNIQGSRDAINIAFNRGLITDGDGWLDMLKSRRLSVHTYDEGTADQLAKDIVYTYNSLFIQLQTRLDVEQQTS